MAGRCAGADLFVIVSATQQSAGGLVWLFMTKLCRLLIVFFYFLRPSGRCLFMETEPCTT